MTIIYLDNNATTQVDPQVKQACDPYFCEEYGNPSSQLHRFGQRAKQAAENARQQVATLIGAKPGEIVFTSTATESNNLALLGAAEMYSTNGKHIITCQTEHPAVIAPCKFLERHGYDVTWLKPDSTGQVSPEQLADAITDQTILISLMMANNETGTLHPVEEIGKIAKQRNIIFHCDAAQAVGKIPVDVQKLGIDLLSASGHKFYAPKGVGFLYVRGRGPKVRLGCRTHGSGHENNLRSGTLNVPGIVGIGKACEIAHRTMDEQYAHLKTLRDRLEEILTTSVDDVTVNGHPTERLPNTLNISFHGVEGQAAAFDLANFVAVSTGAACSTSSMEPSHVLKAMNVPPELLSCSMRLSVGRFNTVEEIEAAGKKIIEIIKARRKMSPQSI